MATQRSKKLALEAAKRKRREEQESNVARKAVANEEARAAKRSRFEPRQKNAEEEE